jgi:hypothetical protein
LACGGVRRRGRKNRRSHAPQRNGLMKKILERTFSRNPFLLDLNIAWLPQFGHREDLSKIDMAYISRSGWGSILYTQTAGSAFFHFRRKLCEFDRRLRRMARRLLRWLHRQAQPEIPVVARIAPVRADEENSVQHLLQEPLSSGPADCRARTVRTEGTLTEDRHGPHLPF